jgi:hypothetical protein
VWQVFLAVLLTACRYGGRDAYLSEVDLVRMTGLSMRSVKMAVSLLVGQGILTRPKRYRHLHVTLGAALAEGGDSHLTPNPSSTGGADKPAPRRGKLICTSPTSIISSSFNKECAGTFSNKQQSVIVDVLAEVTELLGADAGELTLPDAVADQLNLAANSTYTQAQGAIAVSGNKTQARDFVKAVLALRQDPRVQGEELTLTER